MTESQRLSAFVKVRQHHLRSAHLEHHGGQLIERLRSYGTGS